MAIPSVSYTFVNGTSSDANQVNQNFTDLIGSLTDGTKSLDIDALVVGGSATFSGAVTLGDGTPDDITFLGSLASSIPIKTNNSFNIGTSTFGLAGLYLGSASSQTTRLVGAATSSYTATFPVAAPVSKGLMKMATSGAMSVEDYDVDNSTIESNAFQLRIKALGVGTGQLAALSVTPAKLSAPNELLTSSSGSFTMTGGALGNETNITNLSGSFTASGLRRVRCVLVADGTTSSAQVSCRPTSGQTSAPATIRFYRDSTVIGVITVGGSNSTVTNFVIDFHPGGFEACEIPAQGTYTYKATAATGVSATMRVDVLNCKLWVYEL